MPRSRIERIRERIRRRQYDLTVHAVEEMAEDDLDITDVEQAVLTGLVRTHLRRVTFIVKQNVPLNNIMVCIFRAMTQMPGPAQRPVPDRVILVSLA